MVSVFHTKTTTESRENQKHDRQSSNKSTNLIYHQRSEIMKSFTRGKEGQVLGMAGLLIIYHTCSFAQSVEKDLVTGLSSSGNGMSCEEVYLSDGEMEIKRSTFIYGETFYVNFDGIVGFEREEQRAYPEMQMLVLDKKGDTALFVRDMYEGYEDGIDYDPLQLYSQITVANPMHSNLTYDLSVHIKDRKGKGSFKAELEFDVVANEDIIISGEGVTASEIYLFSLEDSHTITNGKIAFNEVIYLLFEGLEGFVVDAGQVQLGLSMLLKDADGNVIAWGSK